MSNQTIKKFKKNDFAYGDEDEYNIKNVIVDKRKEKRIERALKTKDIDSLMEEENDIDEYEDYDIEFDIQDKDYYNYIHDIKENELEEK